MPKGRRWTSWLYYKRGRAGQPRTNPANSQSGSWTRGPPKYKFIALTAVNGKITAWCQTGVSQGLYQSLLLWKTVELTSFQKPQLHYPLQSSSSLSICSSSFPFSVFSIPSFNVLGGYFSCYHLVWWQFPLLERWQISPVMQFSPLSHPCYSIECIALYFLLWWA